MTAPGDMELLLALSQRPEHYGLCIRDIVCHLGLFGGGDHDTLTASAQDQATRLARVGKLIVTTTPSGVFYRPAVRFAKGQG